MMRVQLREILMRRMIHVLLPTSLVARPALATPSKSNPAPTVPKEIISKPLANGLEIIV